MEARQIVTRRFLAAFEQAVSAGLSEGWKDLQPEPGKLRQAAAVLLQAAELPTRQAMSGFFAEIVQRVERRQKGDEEAGLWRAVRGLLDRLGETQPGVPASLFTLALCSRYSWIRPLSATLQDVGGEKPAADEEALAEVARILLRAMARRWSDQDRQREKEGRSG